MTHHAPGTNINIYSLSIITFVLAAVVCAAVVPFVRRLAFATGMFDQPDGDRRVHSEPTPRLGGIAIFTGFMLALFAMLSIALQDNAVINKSLSFRDMSEIIGLLFGGTLMFCVGLWDDVMGMRPRTKFIAQIAVAALAVVLYHFTINGFTLPYTTIYVNLGWGAIPFSLFWYLGMVNAINFADGLDGLVAGLTIIAAVTVLVLALLKGHFLVAIVMCALAGSAAGFLPYNYNPARIFMGDGGAMFIGFVLATASVMGTEKKAISLVLILVVLALPILDTAAAIIRRITNRTPIFNADRGHVHHQLLDLGMTQRQAVTLIYAVCAVLGVIAIVLSHPGALPQAR